MVRQWKKLPRESLSLEAFKRYLDVALGNIVLWWIWWCWINGCAWWSQRFFPTSVILWLYNSMTNAYQAPRMHELCYLWDWAGKAPKRRYEGELQAGASASTVEEWCLLDHLSREAVKWMAGSFSEKPVWESYMSLEDGSVECDCTAFTIFLHKTDHFKTFFS